MLDLPSLLRCRTALKRRGKIRGGAAEAARALTRLYFFYSKDLPVFIPALILIILEDPSVVK